MSVISQETGKNLIIRKKGLKLRQISMGQPTVVPTHKECRAQKCSKVKALVAQLCPALHNPIDKSSPWNSPGQSNEVGSLSLLQAIFPTQGLNPGLQHCRRILYQLSHEEALKAYLAEMPPGTSSGKKKFLCHWWLNVTSPWAGSMPVVDCI